MKDKDMSNNNDLKGKIDWVTTLVPFFGVAALGALFMIVPESSKTVLESVRKFIGDDCAPIWQLHVGSHDFHIGTCRRHHVLFLE